MRLNIKPLVDAKGMNRNQLAKELKIGYKAACNLYEGTTERIYFDTLTHLCEVLDCTPNDIIISDEPESQEKINLVEPINKGDTN